MWITERINIAPSGCWHWIGELATNGYGRIRRGKQTTTTIAHRAVYRELVGPISDGLDLDHLCRNRACVNPEHLEPVTRSVNLRRSPLVGKHGLARTHCVHGHEYTDETTYRRSDGRRQCKVCMADAVRRFQARRRETHNLYGYRHGCRCDDCSAAYKRWLTNWRATRAQRLAAAS